ncbi:MAG: hypothetical protein OHK0022_48050 [Roseiflexaceae bacterium]
MIGTLDQHWGWNLDEAARQRYLEKLLTLVPDDYSDTLLQQMIQNYHLDHQRVDALQDTSHPDHQAAWEEAGQRAMLTLKGNGFSNYANGALDFDDLLQIALMDLSASLERFRYGSRLATWLHIVTLNSARRTLRMQRAARRAGITIPLGHPATEELTIPTTAQPEAMTDYQMLLGLIAAVLQANPDKRLLHIFRLWAIEDQRLTDIGEIMKLSKSRVSTLLDEIRRITGEHLRQQGWSNEEDNSAGKTPKGQK